MHLASPAGSRGAVGVGDPQHHPGKWWRRFDDGSRVTAARGSVGYSYYWMFDDANALYKLPAQDLKPACNGVVLDKNALTTVLSTFTMQKAN